MATVGLVAAGATVMSGTANGASCQKSEINTPISIGGGDYVRARAGVYCSGDPSGSITVKLLRVRNLLPDGVEASTTDSTPNSNGNYWANADGCSDWGTTRGYKTQLSSTFGYSGTTLKVDLYCTGS